MKIMGIPIRQVILFAAVPSVVVIAIISTLKEPDKSVAPIEEIPPAKQHALSRDYRLLLAAVFVFTLGNSTDAFLLMRLLHAGVSSHYVALLWGLHHIFKIGGAWIGGRTSDRIGRKALMFSGLGLYALMYAVFGLLTSSTYLIAVFIVYGISIGILEPTERAWVSELSTVGRRGSAFGFYHASKGFGALPASFLFGFLWQHYGHYAAFLTGAGLALVAAGIVVFIRAKDKV